MALVGPTNLLASSVASTTNGSVYATGSVSPTAGALILVFTWTTHASAAVVPTITAAFTTGGWTQQGNANAGPRCLALSSAIVTSGTGAVTATHVGTMTGCIIHVVQYTGQHATTPLLNIGGGVSGAGATSATVTLPSALSAAVNQICACIGHNTNEAQTATGGGTELANTDVGYATPTARSAIYSEVNDNSVGASWTTSSAWITVGIEVAEAAAAATLPPKSLRVLQAVNRSKRY